MLTDITSATRAICFAALNVCIVDAAKQNFDSTTDLFRLHFEVRKNIFNLTLKLTDALAEAITSTEWRRQIRVEYKNLAKVLI